MSNNFHLLTKNKNLLIQQYMKSTTSQLKIYQFKNAIHIGYMNSDEPFSGSQSYVNMAKSNISSNLQKSPSSLRTSKIGSNNRQTIQNLGITIDDEGSILIAQWKDSKIKGQYFLFKPSENGNGSSSKNAGICHFGKLFDNMVVGDNYLLDINGSIAKSCFQKNKIKQKCYIYHKYRLKHQSTVQCKVLSFQKHDHQNLSYKENMKIVPSIKNMAKTSLNKQSLPTIEIEANQLNSLNNFLSDLTSAYQAQNSSENQKMVFRKFNLTQSEYFIGFAKLQNTNNSQKNKQNNQNVKNFYGFGIIFRNDWPSKHGYFDNGKLNGFGRFYQSELQVYDGFFQNDELVEGFIFDYFQNKTCFGKKFGKNFQIIENTGAVSTVKLLEYKKIQHLKSFDFINNYFSLPNIMFKSPWPYHVFQVLAEQNSIKRVIKEFKNELDISEIQKRGQTTEDKVQQLLIKEMNSSQQTSRILTTRSKINEVKSMAINKGISMYLKLLSPQPLQKQTADQIQLQRNIQQYNDLKNVHQLSTARKSSRRKSRQTSKSKQLSKVSVYYRAQLTQRSTNKPQESNLSQKDISQLINSYKEYEDKKNAVEGKSRTLQSLKLKNQNNVQSRSGMMKQDHKIFMNKKKTQPKCEHRKKKSAVQLDKIYRLYFNHNKKC